MKLINEQEILNNWAPIIQESANITDNNKLNWLSKYCHFHSLNENVGSALSTLGNTPGMGSIFPAQNLSGTPGTSFTSSQNAFYTGATGSGDKFPSLLPLAIQVAAKTIGFDIVNVIPMPGPTGTLAYLDYVYAGGKLTTTDKPIVIKINGGTTGPNATQYVRGTTYWGISATGSADTIPLNTKAVKMTFIGRSRIDGYTIFKVVATYNVSNATGPVVTADDTITIANVFDGSAAIVNDNAGVPEDTTTQMVAVTASASLVHALEDHVDGFSGAGAFDTASYSGPFSNTDGYLAGPMNRGTGESTYYRTMGLQTYTKFVEAETYQVAANITTEQIQDLGKQWGVDVIAMVNNALTNELSQSINKHILSRAFALGWSNNFEFLAAEGTNLNLNLDSTNPSVSQAHYGKEGTSLTIAGGSYSDFGGFENQSTLQRRIYSRLLAAANVISNRGRRGPANFVVVGPQLATAIQDISQFQFAPFANTITQNNGSLYPVGTLAGMTVYVDQNMAWGDLRVCVGRKGGDEEPGIKFMPYMMAESIQTIAEQTMAPKIAVKSRYALVEAGQFPQTLYFTFKVILPTGGIA